MVIDLQIKTDQKFSNGQKKQKKQLAVSGHQSNDSPMVRTVEGSQRGDGVNARTIDNSEYKEAHSPVLPPHTADDGAVRPNNLNESDEERPTRERRTKHRYGGGLGGSESASPKASFEAEDMGVQLGYGGDSGRFNSLILARRIKNENSRMLQSLETRFNILQRNEQRVLKRIEGQRQRAE